MSAVKNFQKRDVADALDLLLHMIGLVSRGLEPSPEDVDEVKRLIAEIRNAR